MALAQQMRAEGQFLVHQEVLGHIYGITSSAVRKLQAMGRLPLLDLDRVQDVEQLRASGFQVCAGGGMLGVTYPLVMKVMPAVSAVH